MNRFEKHAQAPKWGALVLVELLAYVFKIGVDLALMVMGAIGAVLAVFQGMVLVGIILVFALPACAIIALLFH